MGRILDSQTNSSVDIKPKGRILSSMQTQESTPTPIVTPTITTPEVASPKKNIFQRYADWSNNTGKAIGNWQKATVLNAVETVKQKLAPTGLYDYSKEYDVTKDTTKPTITELKNQNATIGYPKHGVMDPFMAGIGDVEQVTGSTMLWLNKKLEASDSKLKGLRQITSGLGTELQKEGEAMQGQYTDVKAQQELGEFDWGDMLNPTWYHQNILRAVPFSLALLPASLAAGAAGSALGLGAFGTFVASSILGGTTSRALESATEAGTVYDELRKKGLSHEEADKQANGVFKKNMSLASLDIGEYALTFMPGGSKVKKFLPKGLMNTGRVAFTGGMGGTEELLQKKFQDEAEGKTFSWDDPETKASVIIGTIMGGGLTTGALVVEGFKTKVLDNLPPDMKGNGKTDDDNLEAIAQQYPEETQKAINEAIKETAQEEDQKIEAMSKIVEDVQDALQNQSMEEVAQGLRDAGFNMKAIGTIISTVTSEDPTKVNKIDSQSIIQEALNESGVVLEETKTPEVPTEQAKMKISKEEPLITEARKYKSAEEFVKAQEGKPIQGLDMTEDDVSSEVNSYIDELRGNMDLEGLDFNIKDIKVVGSRTVGLGKKVSDLDVLLEYSGESREDDVFNALNDKKLKIDGITIDINPIKADRTGSMEEVYKKPTEFYKSQLEDIWNKAQEGEAKMKVKESLTDTQRDEISKTLSEIDTTPATVNGKPLLEDVELYFRLDQLKTKNEKGKLTNQEFIEAKGLLEEAGVGIDTLKTKEDNKVYGTTKYKKDDGISREGEDRKQFNRERNAESNGDTNISKLDKEEGRNGIRSDIGGNDANKNRPTSTSLPRNETRGNIRRIVSELLPEVNPPTIDKIVSYYSRLDKGGFRLDIKRETTNEFEASMRPYTGNLFILSINNIGIKKLTPGVIDHEIGTHSYWSIISNNLKEAIFNGVKEEYKLNPEKFSRFGDYHQKSYWNQFVTYLWNTTLENNMGIIDGGELTDILEEVGLMDKNNLTIYPEDIMDTAFNFAPINDKLNKLILKKGGVISDKTSEANNLMAEEIVAFIAETAPNFTDSTIPELAKYANEIVNDTLEFKKPERTITYKEEPIGESKQKIKLPEVNTGNKAEDAKQILAHVEKKLGVTSVVNSIKDKELAIEIGKEALQLDPMQPFEEYVANGGTYKGQLPEVGGTVNMEDFKRNTNPKAIKFAKEGDSLATELTGNENLTSEDVREQFDDYMVQKEKLAKEEKALKQQKELFKTEDTFKLVGIDKTLIGEITQSREMPETIMEIMDQVKKEKKARREEVLNHPARPLMKYVDRKTQRLPKLGSNTAFGKEGTQILKDLKFDNVAEANQSLSDYISKRNEFINPVSRLALQERAAKFLRDKQKILDEVEKKIKAEARDRKSKIEAIRDFFYMTEGEVRDAIGDKDYRLLSENQFEELLKSLEEKSIEIAKHSVAVAEVEWTIAEKELHRVENMQEVLGYPKDLNKLTTEQLDNLNEVLGKYERGDVFLGVREMETLAKNANLPDVKTQRQILEEVLGKRTGLPIEKLREIVVGSFDDLRSAVSLARQNAFYEVLVSDFYQLKIEAGLRYREIEQKTNELVRKARESRKQNWKQKLAPTDDMVIAYLEEGDLPTKALIAKDMSPQELELAHYVQQQYADMRDFLIARQQLDKARQNYYTHRPRGFFESWLRDGVVKSPSQFIKAFGRAFKETFIDVNKMDEATFKILNEQTEEILPLEKFFKYSMRRSGQLIPTKNLANAFLGYAKTFELKKGLDQYMPRMEAVARALTPTETTEGGVVMDTSLEKFVKKWINTQKGRPVTVGPIQPGGVLDGLLRSGVAFTRFLDLALRLPAQVMSIVGEESATWINIGTKKYALGQYRAKTKQGERIAKKYESFVGTTFWDKMKEESSGIGSKLGETIFAFYGIAARKSNVHHLLGVLTKQEFESGNISPERLVEIKMEMNRWRADDLLKSVMGATSVGAVFREHKSWAIPIVNQTLSNVKTLSKMVQSGEYKQASKSKEFNELFRATMLTLILVLTLSRIYKDLKEKKDRNLAEELEYRALNDAQSFLAALSPATLGSVPRLAGWFTDLTKALTDFAGALATGDRTATGDIPGAKGLGASVTPKLIKPLFKDTEEDKVNTSILTSTIKAQKELDVIKPEVADPAKKAWDEVKKVGVGTEEADAIVGELSDDQYEAYKLVKKADEEYWTNLSEKVTPIVKQAFKLEFGSEEANKLVEPLSNDEYAMYKTVKSNLYGKGEATAQPSDWDKQSFITHVTNMAKGWTTDPVDAFKKIIKGGDWKITDIKNGQIIVDRMPMDASEKIKEEAAKNNKNWKADHVVSVKLGGGSEEKNINIIPTDQWEENTPVEVYLIRQLDAGNITGKQAKEYIIRYKGGTGQLNGTKIFEDYKNKYNESPLTFEQIKQLISK